MTVPIKLPGAHTSARNIAATWAAVFAGSLFTIFAVPLVVWRFGVVGLGIWLLVQQIAGLLQLFEIGLNSGLGRFLARAQAQGDLVAYGAYLSSTLAMLVGLGAVVMLASVGLAAKFPVLFEMDPLYVRDSQLMVLVAGGLTALTLPLRTAAGVLSSQHRFDLIAKWEFLTLALKGGLVVVVCLVDIPHGLIWVSAAVFGSMFLTSLLMLREALQLVPEVRIGRRGVTREAIKRLLEVSASASLISAGAVALRLGSPTIVGLQFGAVAVPLLALPILLVTALGQFTNVAMRLISPVASQLDATSERQRLFGVLRLGAHYSLALLTLIFLLVLGGGHLALGLWLSAGDFSATHLAQIETNLLILLAGYCLTMPALIGRAVLASIGKHWAATSNELISVALGLSVGTVLLYVVGFPVWGMAVGIVVSYFVRIFGPGTGVLARYFTLSLPSLFRALWGRPLAVAAISLTVFMLVREVLDGADAAGWLGLIAAIPVWLVLTWSGVLTAGHRVAVLRIFGRMLARIQGRG